MSIGKSIRPEGVDSKMLDNAIALHQGGWHHEALDLYRKILTADPTNSVALTYGGVALLETGNVDDAVAQLENAADLYPDVADIRGYLANALQLAKRPEAAEAHYLKAADLEPNDPTPHSNLGVLLKDNNRLDEAMERFYRAIDLNPDYGPAYSNLCECLRRKDRVTESIEAGKQAIAIDPGSAKAHNNLGVALIAADRIEDAIAAYGQAVAIDPVFIDALNNLSIAQIISARPDDALMVVDKCLKADAGNIQALATLSVALHEIGDGERIAAHLDYNLLTRATTIDAPPGYDSLADFNRALADHVRNHPTLAKDPEGNATRAGMHSGDLLAEPAGPFNTFETVIHDAISDYMKAILRVSDHPFFAKIPAQYALDVWGIVLSGEGHQIPHIHPGGWLSGCYYPEIPPSISPEDPARRGWFEFGRPQPLYKAKAAPDVRPVCPHQGLLLLFPSFFFHRTVPVETAEERISIAFDVLPLGR